MWKRGERFDRIYRGSRGKGYRGGYKPLFGVVGVDWEIPGQLTVILLLSNPLPGQQAA